MLQYNGNELGRVRIMTKYRKVAFSGLENQFLLHSIFISSALENWRAHCNEFEERFRDFVFCM